MKIRTGLILAVFLAFAQTNARSGGGPELPVDQDIIYANGFEGFALLGGRISGTLYSDPDSDGNLADGEPLAGVEIYLDLNYNGRFDPSDPSVTTGSDGGYLFVGVSAGIKHVRQTLAPPNVQTFPGNGSRPLMDMLPDEVVSYTHSAPGVGQFDVPYGENASDWPAGWGEVDLGPNAELVDSVDLVLAPIGVRKLVPGIGTRNGTEFLNLPTDARITVRFDEAIIDGPGADLIIHSISGASRNGEPEIEQAEVLIGASEFERVSVGIRQQESTIAVDLADHGLVGPIHYVELISQNNAGGWWGFELVGMEAVNIASPDPGAHVVNVTPEQFEFEGLDFGRYYQDFLPTVVIGAADSNPAAAGFRVGESLTLQVNASDDLGVDSVTLEVNGQSLALDDEFSAQIDLVQVGELYVEAGATDTTGQTATRTAQYYVLNADGSFPFDPNLVGAGASTGIDPPTVRILSPAIGASLSQDVAVVASMTGTPEPVEWTLEYAPVELIDPFDLAAPDPDYIEIASGAGNVFSAPIGTVPLESLADGIYFLRLSASNSPSRVAYSGQVLAKNIPAAELRPEIVIDGPTSGSSASVSAAITGTIQSTRPLIEWFAEYAPADTVDLNNPGSDAPDWIRFAEGSDPIPVSALIASFDATRVRNNSYVVRIVARNDIGLGRVEGIVLDVVGEAKLGRNRLEFLDLQIDMAGFPLEFVRVYDSLEADVSGDLGYGWSLQLRDADIRETVPDTGSLGLFGSTPFRDGTRVYLNAPGGERVGFTFKPEPGAPSPLGQPYRVVFEPDPGNYHRLEVAEGDLEFLALNPDGSVSLFFFNLPYNPERYVLITPDGTRYTYHEDSGLLQAEDLNGNALTFNPTGIQHSSGQQLRFERDAQGRITEIIDPEGNTWSYGYDADGDLVSHTTADGDISIYTYLDSPAHFLDTLFDPQGRQPLRYEYDPDDGRMLAIIDQDGNRQEMSFSPAAFSGTQSDRRGNVTAIQYDARGNITRREDANGNVTRYEYNDPANPDRETRMIDAEGGIWNYEYDAWGRPTVLETPMASGSSNQVSTIQYDALGNIIEYKDPDNNVSSYSYDAQGNPTGAFPYGGVWSQFEYGANGKRSLRRGEPSFAVRYEYDANGFLSRQSDPTGYALELTHLANGRLVERSDNTGDLLVTFTPAGILSSQTDARGNSIVLVENPDGSLSRSDRNGNLTTIDIDAEHRPTLLTLPSGVQVETSHDADGNIDVITDPLGNTVDHDFDASGELVAITDHLGNSDSFAHDGNGNIIEIVDRNGKRRSFEYDANQRLIREHWHDGGGAVIRTLTWNYAANRGLVEVLDDTGDALYGQSTSSNNLLRPTRVDYALPGQEDWRVTTNRSDYTDYPVAVGVRVGLFAHQSIFFTEH